MRNLLAAGNTPKAPGIAQSKPPRAREPATDTLASLLPAAHSRKKTAATRIALSRHLGIRMRTV